MIEYNKKSYMAILNNAIASGYDFTSYDNVQDKSLLLRHDIDVSPKLALEMAKIENGLGVRSTYFLMIRSPFYNLFSRANNEIVKEIILLGHEIGLHYDEGYYPENADLQTLINNEIKILENNFDIKIKVVSFHQPSPKIINNKVKIKQINTYDKEYFRKVKYLSDSNMDFKENPLLAIRSKRFSKIQLLIHPMWWVTNGNTTEEKFMEAIKLNFDLEQKQMLHTERAYGCKKKMILEVEHEFIN